MPPLLPWAALGTLLFHCRRRGASWGEAVATAGVLWGVYLTAITEALSAAGRLQSRTVAAAWLAALLLGALTVARVAPLAKGAVDPPRRSERLLLAGSALLLLLVGVIAFSAPPNNFDTNVYHMSRVMHWIQNGSVEHYPTHILRQLHQGPWSEWAVLHLQLLAGGDLWANSVQWLSLVGCAAMAGSLARSLGGTSLSVPLAALFAASLPMALAQASTPKNDVVTAFWLLAFLSHLPRAMDASPAAATLAGGALGLALLTKPTAYLFALPFAIVACGVLLRRHRREGLAVLAAPVLLMVALNAGHALRNTRTYGGPLGPLAEGDDRYTNEALGLRPLASNLLRNLALHADTRVPDWNSGVDRAVRRAHRFLGVDVDDPRTSWSAYVGPQRVTSSDTIGNPWHLLLLLSALLAALSGFGQRRTYALCLLAAGLLFCAVLKWQPWHSRLHIPWFLLAAPLVGAVCADAKARWAPPAFAILFLWGLYRPLISNDGRSLAGQASVFREPRLSQYFVNQRDLEQPYVRAARHLRRSGCERIGLASDVDWEYPLWVLLGAPQDALRIEHVEVRNASRRHASREPFASFEPCAVVTFNWDDRREAEWTGHRYLREARFGPIGIFRASPSAAAVRP